MVGETAENFILKDQYGKDFELYKNLDKNILLVFYPADDTFVCSRQLSDYNDNIQLFLEKGIKIAGINPGSIKSHKNFCNKLDLNFSLLSDENKSVSKKYDAINLFRGIKRKLVLINRERIIVFDKPVFAFRFITVNKLFKILTNKRVI